MRTLILWLAAGISLILVSCTTVSSTSAVAEVDAKVVQFPTVADLDVGTQRTATVTWPWMPFNILQPSLETRQKNLMAQMISEAGADILVEPRITTKGGFFGTQSMTITGYPAKFKSFRKATATDLRALRSNISPLESRIYDVSKQLSAGCHVRAKR